MVTLAELQNQVADSYDRLGMLSWPDPHPDGASPRDEEYSRVTEPERYRIVHVRARVWADRLGGLAGAEVEDLGAVSFGYERRVHKFDRGVRVSSQRPGTLPLFLLERDAPSAEQRESVAVLHISVVRPELVVETLPDCGCDACDFGSDDLLRAIDETIAHVVGGPFVALRGDGWNAQWHPGGGSASGGPRRLDFDKMQDMCRRLAAGEDVRLPRGAEAFVGHSWLS